MILQGSQTRSGIHHQGQSLVEFALLLPLFALLIVGIFDLGRAFFAYIAISNAAREGARVYTFDTKKATLQYIDDAIDAEIGSSTVVRVGNITSIEIHCVDPSGIRILVDTNAKLAACKSEQPFEVTITYSHELLLSFFFSGPLTLVRTAQMMVP